MPRLRLLPLLATACLVLAGCDPPTTISTEPSLLADVPTRIQVDGRELVLDTYLFRDFMPASPPDGRPLIAGLKVRTVDGSPLPAGIGAETVSVLYLDEVWTAPARLEHPSQIPSVLELVARDGPKWGPAVNVDVVLQLRDRSGQAYRLRAADQPIHRTD
ncbi:MAG TPA: hypothetical protein VFT45_09245 [Longimicrobium sp.]|nr:hypothetical protein [Longimicrobium sp.]